jgi:hypothetical protein
MKVAGLSATLEGIGRAVKDRIGVAASWLPGPPGTGQWSVTRDRRSGQGFRVAASLLFVSDTPNSSAPGPTVEGRMGPRAEYIRVPAPGRNALDVHIISRRSGFNPLVAREIVEDLEAALEQFRLIADELGQSSADQ